MARAFTLPDLGEGVHEAEIQEVIVSQGASVEEGDPVLVVETDKAAVEVPSPYTGTIAEIRVTVGDIVQVGDVLITFDGEEAAAAEPAEEEPEPAAASAAAERPAGPIPASPATRRLARELAVDLQRVSPSGAVGRVTAEDVRAFAAQQGEAAEAAPPKPRRPARPAAPAAESQPDFSRWGAIERVPLRSVRRAIAQKMAEAWARIPHVSHHDVADITALECLRRDLAHEVEDGTLALTVFVMKVAVAALKMYPRFNAKSDHMTLVHLNRAHPRQTGSRGTRLCQSCVDRFSLDVEAEEIILKQYYHLGITVDTERGLIVPVIRDVDRKSLAELAAELPAMAQRARHGHGRTDSETQVAVIGGGPGGYAAAFRAADLGLDVTLIDAEPQLGGVYLLRGCIPSKALLQVTKLLRDTQQADAWGLQFEPPQVDLEKMRTWKDEVVATLAKGLSQLSQQRQINVIQARATFEAADRLRLRGADLAHVTFEHAILATGSVPIALPGVPFAPGSRIMDAAAALALSEIPETLLVMGGGYIGLELGSVYAALGSRVTVVELTDGLLPGIDRDLVRPLARRAERLFAAVHLQTKVTALKEHAESVEVSLEGQINKHGQRFSRVLVAIGRRPNTQDLGLDRTRVELTDREFVVVDEHQRTTDGHIFAVGDMVGEPMLAHKAMHEGKIAAEVIAGEPAAFDARCIPAIVYTDPEVAWCGLMQEEARAQGRAITVGRFPWRASGRAWTVGATDGLTKLICEAETERVLGVGVVGSGAEDLIAEGALAIELGAVAQDLALTIHAHPTLSETVAEAAEALRGMATDIAPDQRQGEACGPGDVSR